jgi:hypothetical protein
VLGGPGLELVRAKLAKLTAEIDAWQARSEWTDHPGQ